MRKSIILPSYGLLAATLAAADSLAGSASSGTSSGDMGAMESETGFLSLADLAGLQTDDVTVLLNRVPPAGVWLVRGESIKVTQGEKRDDGKLPPFRISYGYLVLGGKSTDPEYDNDKMVDRKLRESFTIWPTDMEEGIGLTKGRYQKAGIEYRGPRLGGVEGQEPGWLDNFVGAEFELKIRHGQRNGETVAYYDWQKPEAAAESGE